MPGRCRLRQSTHPIHRLTSILSEGFKKIRQGFGLFVAKFDCDWGQLALDFGPQNHLCVPTRVVDIDAFNSRENVGLRRRSQFPDQTQLAGSAVIAPGDFLRAVRSLFSGVPNLRRNASRRL